LETDNRAIVSLIQRNLIRTISVLPVILEKLDLDGKIVNIALKEKDYLSQGILAFWNSFLDNLGPTYPSFRFAKFTLTDFDDPDLFLELVNSSKNNISAQL
jgi:hypothetical protein